MPNDSANLTGAEGHQAPDPILHLTPVCRVLAIVIYSALSVVGVYGNALVICVVCSFRRLRTPTNILIVNLAVGDLLISVLCAPFSYWHVLIFDDQRWLFGAPFCQLSGFLQATAVFLSSWTLVVISFDRCLAVMCVLSPRARLTRRRAIFMLALVWAFSALIALPLFVANQLVTTADGVTTCAEDWTVINRLAGWEAQQAYAWLLFAFQYCIPLAVLIVTYTAIGLTMWQSGRKLGRESTHTALMARDRQESVKKLIPMVILVSALYAGCWLPQNLLMNILLPWHPELLAHPYILYAWWCAHTIAMLHSVVNPLVYYWRNERFREGFRYFSRWLPGCRRFDRLKLLADARTPASSKTGAVRYMNLVAYMPVAAGRTKSMDGGTACPTPNQLSVALESSSVVITSSGGGGGASVPTRGAAAAPKGTNGVRLATVVIGKNGRCHSSAANYPTPPVATGNKRDRPPPSPPSSPYPSHHLPQSPPPPMPDTNGSSL